MPPIKPNDPLNPIPGASDGTDNVYDHDDWRALSRRLALKRPNRPSVRFSRPLLAFCAVLLIVIGVLMAIGY